MSGQHRWAPGAALTVADLVALIEPAWPTDDPDTVAWVEPDADGEPRVYRRKSRALPGSVW